MLLQGYFAGKVIAGNRWNIVAIMENYNKLDQFLHNMALSGNAAKELTFDIEKSLYLKNAPSVGGANIFISGLARAGTTVLLNAIYGSNQFASLTYSDMPFVLAPNLWNKVSNSKNRNNDLRERAHGDGIFINTESPEALDEILWSLFDYPDFEQEQSIFPYSPTDEAFEEFLNFMQLVCLKYKKKRYLSKNNNNIFRLHELSKQLPQSVFLVPFRNPAFHAISLMTQHEKFLNSSDFEAKYMGWLGHFEFGRNHKFYKFRNMKSYKNSTSYPDFWLETWINTYEYLLPTIQNESNVHAVCYEQLDSGNRAYFLHLSKVCNVDIDPSVFSPKNKTSNVALDSQLLEKANYLYDQLVNSTQIS